jgi:aspartate/tyrosine/aromatic aminotransferase
MCEKLMTLPPKTTVLLHATCHNPTGRDPELTQWQKIFTVMQKKELIPFFDCAYQGFGHGLEKDVEALRFCLQYCREMLVAYSCSKNFSLYNERVGALYVITDNSSSKFRVGSQVKRIIRALYSNPPSTGARIVAEVLKNVESRKEWTCEVDAMRKRIEETRESFIHRLVSRSKNVDFRYLKGYLGLFMFVDLTKTQVDRLIHEYGVYLLDNGRMSMAGLNQKNIDYVVDSILKVC